MSNFGDFVSELTGFMEEMRDQGESTEAMIETVDGALQDLRTDGASDTDIWRVRHLLAAHDKEIAAGTGMLSVKAMLDATLSSHQLRSCVESWMTKVCPEEDDFIEQLGVHLQELRDGGASEVDIANVVSESMREMTAEGYPEEQVAKLRLVFLTENPALFTAIQYKLLMIQIVKPAVKAWKRSRDGWAIEIWKSGIENRRVVNKAKCNRKGCIFTCGKGMTFCCKKCSQDGSHGKKCAKEPAVTMPAVNPSEMEPKSEHIESKMKGTGNTTHAVGADKVQEDKALDDARSTDEAKNAETESSAETLASKATQGATQPEDLKKQLDELKKKNASLKKHEESLLCKHASSHSCSFSGD